MNWRMHTIRAAKGMSDEYGRAALLLCVIGLAVGLGCSGPSQRAPSSDSQSAPSEGLADRPAANGQATEAAKTCSEQREITVSSLPFAKCVLGSATSQETMPVWADDVGIVHLWGTPTTAPASYRLDCDEGGVSRRYALELSDTATFRPATPRVAPTGRRTRPALADPMGPTDAELHQRGYPPRPSPTSPMYSKWLEMVSVPTTLVPGHDVPRPDMSFNPVTIEYDKLSDGGWAGLVVNAPQVRYSGVIANFTVPRFTSTGTNANASMWVGLDGVGTSEMIQAGITYGALASDTNCHNIGAYQAWYEYYAFDAFFGQNVTTPQFPCFAVNPGDSITVEVWEGDSQCNFGYPNDVGYGCFYLVDNTTGLQMPMGNGLVGWPWPEPLGYGTFTGATCEAIMEPQPPGSPRPIAKWSTANIQFDCYDYFYGEHNAGNHPSPLGEPYLQLNLQNDNGQTLIGAGKTDPDIARFFWVRAQ
jgi:hypothetical protein